MSEVQRAFAHHFDSITTVVPFQVEWNNGTGYMDGAVKTPLAQTSKSECPNTGRRLILIPTQFGGNVVVFERFKPKQERSPVIVSNVPGALRCILPGSEWTASELWRFCDSDVYSSLFKSAIVHFKAGEAALKVE